MRIGETFPALLFAAALAGIYVAATGFATLHLLHRAPKSAAVRAVRNAVWAVAAVGMACILHSFFEPYRLTSEHVTLTSTRLRSPRGIRIVQVSDTHCDPQPRLEADIVQFVTRCEPDLIVVTGDAANSPHGIPVFQALARRLVAIAPAYAVRGNWDSRYWSRDVFAGTGLRELSGEAVTLDLPGGRIWVAGAPMGESWWARQLAPQAPPDAVKLFLYHTPDAIEPAADADMDVCLAGHTHGGQVALPYYGALITLTRSGRKYQRGLYRVGDMSAYVSRGIGMEGHGMPRVRFCSPPEVTVIDIVPDVGAAPSP
jgi:hypothetical protein